MFEEKILLLYRNCLAHGIELVHAWFNFEKLPTLWQTSDFRRKMNRPHLLMLFPSLNLSAIIIWQYVLLGSVNSVV
jgi:hypothetical protein